MYPTEIAPHKAEVVRSDVGGKFYEREFGYLCRREKIRQEFTTSDTPEYNDVAERQIGIIESASLAAKIQSSVMYPSEDSPRGDNIWAEQANWACDAINRTSTSANPGCKFPHEMWFGSPPTKSPMPFLKPGFRKVKRENNLKPKAVKCWYLGRVPNFPRDAVRVLSKSGMIIVTRNVTWAHAPNPRFPPTPTPCPME